MTIEGECENYDNNHPDDGWCFWGALQITETEQDQHDQLVKLLPKVVVITRWRWIDELPWDVELFSEPLRAETQLMERP